MDRAPFMGGDDDGLGIALAGRDRWGSRVTTRLPDDLVRRIRRDGSIRADAVAYAPWSEESSPNAGVAGEARLHRGPRPRALSGRELRAIGRGIHKIPTVASAAALRRSDFARAARLERTLAARAAAAERSWVD